jgi:hypothetical protein
VEVVAVMFVVVVEVPEDIVQQPILELLKGHHIL